ncbi:MAG TPA: hypothetical protein VFQ61_31295 [Polyangiaceae bacterium]|nr:hypothetical protein [Polyangiaceae bacterium]
MRRALKDTKENLLEFVEQLDHCLLLVGMSDVEVPYVLKTLEQIRAENPASLYVAFADEFQGEHDYGLAFAQRLEQLLTLENEERAAEKRELLAPFPPDFTAPHTPAKQRIVLAFEHLRGWILDPTVDRVVIALVPMQAQPGPLYGKFVAQFAVHQGVRDPWMAYGRVIGREDRTTHSTSDALNFVKADGMLAFDVDFSTEAMAEDLSKDAVDPSLPVADRMQAVLQLAAVDMSYKRYDEAVAKYVLLHGYYGSSGAPLMQSMCLLGIGDCMRMAGQVAMAKEKYQQGLAQVLSSRPAYPVPVPPLADGSPNPNPPLNPEGLPILLNLLLAAGESSMSLQQWQDARDYFESASGVAARCMNPYAAADAMDRQGDAELMLGKPAEAIKAWADAEKIAEAGGYTERRIGVLSKTQRLYEEAQHFPEARQAAERIERIRNQANGPKEPPPGEAQHRHA